LTGLRIPNVYGYRTSTDIERLQTPNWVPVTHLPYVYIEALEPHSINRVLILDRPFDRFSAILILWAAYILSPIAAVPTAGESVFDAKKNEAARIKFQDLVKAGLKNLGFASAYSLSNVVVRKEW